MVKGTEMNQPVFETEILNTLSFRDETLNAKTECRLHTHSFGQLIYVLCGVMETQVGKQRFLAPPEFCIWIPQNTAHSSYNKKALRFWIIDISPQWSKSLPQQPCLIRLSRIFNTIMTDFFEREIRQPEAEQDQRLARVLIDQLEISPRQCTYLPSSKDKLLAPILQELERNPADNTSLLEWAKKRYTSERTLSRRCQQELGMSFGEWRQRLRFLHAISLLEQGKNVYEIAFDVGYSSSSAFITMFQQLAGTTPERFRKG
ncbi:helix-turn-helix transcriptional regulator [Xenorhabdus nematophila]|uniref:Arabinose operon regulatory protein n=1 Tax=Xenorhabdus nematophila (strain ATCC 19061 / DSM 3370 / CCUG 14189 / LMG 1036 / NCIMB 9965 / AN6) TaxID=406817 RepID=D3VKW3_XENNA|nr:helix-turn-helix transcriptional regulator [Xenorhabdus nematophila]CEE94112.1 putative AraC-family regulatory protein [Xenorhabdus nematophila str. Anatoliense]CEF28541.1 putative AraC-family regulatory protein [Xenorhabdus nematophila str. Websteri]AYA39779.1 AraC family transcriptional regulator [Xenorhabdus nematophila]KHD27743.1 AraC family transcriptional regulator [Xenorhabdus nematophila]MBA0018346.1 helix-turn-helix transcriptional regulator [Xenorhabdus nematophila]